MNTPDPCNKCDHCHFDPMYEDDPNYSAYCALKKSMGKFDCKYFKYWENWTKRCPVCYGRGFYTHKNGLLGLNPCHVCGGSGKRK